MNILAIAAHPDDIEILCGGTLAIYAQAGHKVFCAVATDGSVGTPDLTKAEIAAVRKAEQQAACDVIGAEMIWIGLEDEWVFDNRETRTKFLDAIRQADPDVMFVHSPNDYLSDHRNAGQIAVDCRIPASVPLVETLLPNIRRIPHVFFMDNVSGLGFDPEHYVDISGVIETKEQMLRCHASQDIWMQKAYGEGVVSIMKRMASFRGLATGAKYAEAFRSLRTYPVTDPLDFLPPKA